MKKLFLLALVATALFSCSKESDEGKQPHAESKTVIVKFAPAALGRAVEEPVTGSATVSEFTIFFLNAADKVVKGTTSGTDASKAVACVNVGTDATKVYVVANANKLLNLDNATTLANIQAQTAAVSTQGNIQTVVLSNLADKADNGKITSTTDEKGDLTYAAAVTIAPALARIEIAGVECTTATTGFTVAAIYLDGYATTLTMGGGYDQTATEANVVAGIFNAGKEESNLPMASNSFADVANVVAASNVAKPDGSKKWAYQIAAGAPLPRIIVKLIGITDDTQTRYITVGSYKLGTTPYGDLLKAGSVYTISNIPFARSTVDNPLPETPNASDRDVSVSVSIQAWNVVALSPVL